MKIKIDKCDNNAFWYSDRIGEVFDAIEGLNGHYLIPKNNGSSLFYVSKRNAKVIYNPSYITSDIEEVFDTVK